jgi:glycosyltransferase involved in cell wall biosynthesis
VLSASVIVPTFNRPATLSRTLEALRGMDFPANRLEIVVVDSGTPGAQTMVLRLRATTARGALLVSSCSS